jgi:hypothetical protein
MKATHEYRRWFNRMRKRFSGKNGNVSGALLDNPKMERRMQSGKKEANTKDTSG